jgi:glycerol-3-phosphate cytidylyltransferase-like family protein
MFSDMKTVLLQGAFELYNAGHALVLKECKSQGDHLILALNTNELLREYKGRDAVLPWDEKKIIFESVRWVDQVVAAPDFSPLALLKEYNVDVYCLSHEWESTKTEEIAYMRDKGGSIFWTTDYPIVRTSEIKRRLLMEAQEKLPSHW